MNYVSARHFNLLLKWPLSFRSLLKIYSLPAWSHTYLSRLRALEISEPGNKSLQILVLVRQWNPLVTHSFAGSSKGTGTTRFCDQLRYFDPQGDLLTVSVPPPRGYSPSALSPAPLVEVRRGCLAYIHGLRPLEVGKQYCLP